MVPISDAFEDASETETCTRRREISPRPTVDCSATHPVDPAFLGSRKRLSLMPNHFGLVFLCNPQNSASGRLSRLIFEEKGGLFSVGVGAAVAGIGRVKNVTEVTTQVQTAEWFVGRAYSLLQEVSTSLLPASSLEEVTLRSCRRTCVVLAATGSTYVGYSNERTSALSALVAGLLS